jgi:N6-adenosine-specific RNA methylase IME4
MLTNKRFAARGTGHYIQTTLEILAVIITGAGPFIQIQATIQVQKIKQLIQMFIQ